MKKDVGVYFRAIKNVRLASRTGHRTHLVCVCVSELFIGIKIKTGEGMERGEILEMTDEAEGVYSMSKNYVAAISLYSLHSTHQLLKCEYEVGILENLDRWECVFGRNFPAHAVNSSYRIECVDGRVTAIVDMLSYLFEYLSISGIGNGGVCVGQTFLLSQRQFINNL